MATRNLPPKPLRKPVQTPQRQKPKDPVEVSRLLNLHILSVS